MHVVAAIYSVVGRRGSIASTDQTMQQMNLAIQNGRPASRRAVVSGYDLIQTDKFLPGGNTFGPGDRDDISRTIDLSLPTEYDAIALRATALVVRQEDVIINEDISQAKEYSWDLYSGEHLVDAPQWVANPGVDYLRYQVPIGETNYLREQTRRSWIASVWRVLGDLDPAHPGSYLTWRFQPNGSPLNVDLTVADKDNRAATERYGLAWSDTELQEKSVYEMKLREVPPTK